MKKSIKSEYLAKVKLLSKEEAERLLSRMGGKLDRRLEKRKVSQEEALARQLELEDEQLQEWRKMMQILRDKEQEKARKKAKAKGDEKVKVVAKAKTPAKPKVVAKAKALSKSKVAVKTKVPSSSKAKSGR